MLHEKCGLEFREGAKGSCLNCRRINKLLKKGYTLEDARKVPARADYVRTKDPEWRASDEGKRWRKNAQLKSLYGITVERYDEMREWVGYRCQICGEHEDTIGTLCVDHCHTSGEVRGLLCRMCNKSIGGLKDSLAIVQRAANYLEVTNGTLHPIHKKS